MYINNALEKRLPHNEQQTVRTLHDNEGIVTVTEGVHYTVLQEPT
jgi:hypothetical protein